MGGEYFLYSTTPEPLAPFVIDRICARRGDHASEPIRLVVMQTPLEVPDDEQVGVLLRQFSGHGLEVIAADSGIRQREDAYRSDVVSTIVRADLILATGGDPVRMAQIIEGTPAEHALHDAHVCGAVIGGGSAGAMVWGHGVLDRPRDAPAPTPLLGWLQNVVVAPHYGMYPIEPWRVAFPDSLILGLPDDSAILIQDDGSTFTSLGMRAAHILLPTQTEGQLLPSGVSWRRPS